MSDESARLLGHHREFLRLRAVADDVAQERGYESAVKKSDLEKRGFGRKQQLPPALVIPIWSVRREVESYQLRPDFPRLNDKGKVRKYEMKAGSQMLLDVHPRLNRPCVGSKVALVANPLVPLFVTEGIPKADAAISIKLCCLAVLGVWNFRGTNPAGGKIVLPDWESVALNGRTVYVVYDSDVMEKPQANAALVRLKALLESRKAIVKLIYLPAGEHGQKMGLDDFIAQQKTASKSDAEIRNALLALATDELRKPPGRAGEGSNQVGIYRETERGIIRVQVVNEQEIEIPLTNFTARIISDITHDDGAETTRAFGIEARLGERWATFTVPAIQFAGMRWTTEQLGAQAVVYAGQGTADHARVAIQLLSQSPARHTVYAHTGWRIIASDWVYLHAGGAIGAAGAVEGSEVSLPPELSAFKLELPADSAAAKRAIAASLRLLDVGPDRITVPMYGVVWRAILGGADFSNFLYGRTGVFKTELSALIQQHFGAGFHARHLPTSFTSTANTHEALAFAVKDAVLVVDELHPPASGSEREQMYRDAARLLRSQGNAAGRGRMRADASLRPSKPPRGLVLATGEELLRGQSLHARVLTTEVQQGSINTEKLTGCQSDAAAGLYAQATGTFIRWLAPHLVEARVEFEKLRRELRNRIHHDHARTTDIRAQLTAAYSIFIEFLIETEVVDADHANRLQSRIGAALEEAANAQAHFSATTEPVGAFIRLLTSAISSGHAHLADFQGGAPKLSEQACGWRRVTIGTGEYQRDEWQPRGDRVGWVDGEFIYLDRDAAYRAARGMAADGTGVEVSVHTLMRRLRDRGFLARVDQGREVLTVRQSIEGRRQDVVCLLATRLSIPLQQPDQPDHDGENDRGAGRANGSF